MVGIFLTRLPKLFSNWLTLAYLSLLWILMGLCSEALQSFLHYQYHVINATEQVTTYLCLPSLTFDELAHLILQLSLGFGLELAYLSLPFLLN